YLGGFLGRLSAIAFDAIAFRELHEIRLDWDRRGSITFVKEKILPLFNHTQELVVQDDGFHVEIMFFHDGQFLHGHLETAVPRDVNDRGVRISERGPDRRRETKTHRSQPARSDPTTRL